MAVLPIGIGSAAGAGGYQIERSLRFNSADSAHLNRTLGTSNRRTFTFSAWLKRSVFASTQCIFGNINYAGGGSTNQQFYLGFTGSDQLDMFHYNNGTQNQVTSSAVYRDPSAWYHIVGAVDTTQATSSNRLKIYVNGSQITALATATYPAQNTDTFINANLSTGIGRQVGTGITGSYYNDGYLTEINFIDGQALTPSDFGETDSNTGVWKPKAFSGTYGTNGFYLKFADNSGTTSTTLGKDTSGNGNNWTPNNFSVTAGAGNDSMVDTPTSYGTDTGAGGTVRGNYCTFNPLVGTHSNTYSDGNLQLATSTANAAFSHQRATFGVSSGKWYWEITCQATNTAYYVIGLASDRLNPDTQHLGNGSSGDGYLYRSDTGNKGTGGTYTAYGNTFTTGDIIGVAYDADNGKLWFSKNGTWQNSGSPSGGTNEAFSSITGTYYPAVTDFDNNTGRNSTFIANFGQRAFAYTAPSGFKALCTQNLPTPTIGATSTTQANDYFDVVLRTSAGSAGSSVTSLNFQPDFIWDKTRSITGGHYFEDAVRGVGKYLLSNSTAAEQTDNNYISAFTSNGFTIGNNDWAAGTTIVDWCWKANGAGSSNTAGTITSTVSANTTSGFSIVTFNIPGSGTSDTVGHGLGVAPSMVILKPRTAGTSWGVYHSGLTSAAYYLTLQTTNGQTLSNNWWNSTAPTSSVFTIGATWYGTTNAVAYCFAPVAGYSAFGSYTGNGSADGPFVYTGFRPRYILWKVSSGTTGHWEVVDTARETYNQSDQVLFASSSGAESAASSSYYMDILSNGFKIRNTDTSQNGNTYTYIYACFAESPFKYALAR